MTFFNRFLTRSSAVLGLVALAACGTPTEEKQTTAGYTIPPDYVLQMYGEVQDGEFTIPAVHPAWVSVDKARKQVHYPFADAPGSIVVDPYNFKLWHVQPGGTAMEYTIAVGEAGRTFAGEATIKRKVAWPSWTPTANMIRREPDLYGKYAGGLAGGPDNPLGSRALYLYQGGRDTLFRIHGSPQPYSIGTAASSGCIRLYQQDAIHLFNRTNLGTSVKVLNRAESVQRIPPLDPLGRTDSEVAAAGGAVPAEQAQVTQTSAQGFPDQPAPVVQ